MRNNMRNKIRAAMLLSGVMAAIIPQVNAATVDLDFDVSVTFASACTAVSSGTQTLDFGTYTVNQVGVQNASPIDVVFECTRGLTPVSVTFDAIVGTAIGGGTIAGLNYDIDVGAPVIVAGTASSSAVNDIGTADTSTYTISGAMPALQVGTDGAAASHTRTLILTY